MRALAWLVSVSLLVVGCGAGDSSTPTPAGSGGAGGAAGTSGFLPAPHTPFPTVTNGHGPIIPAARVALVTYDADSRAVALREHMTWLASSTWLPLVGADYGVGSATLAASLAIPDAPPTVALLDDVVAMLSAHVSDGSLPAPDDQTIYVVHYPAETDVVRGAVIACRSYLAYHDEAMIAGKLAPFVVVPACPTSFAGRTDTDSAAVFAAEFLLDAATNPFPRSAPGFVLGDQSSPWTSYGEDVGELCPFLLADVEDHVVPRVWSTTAAAASTDPCLPVTDHDPMFGVTTDPATVQTAAAGETVTFTVTAWSASPMASFHLKVLPLRSDIVAPAVLGATTLSNGDQTTLSVTLPGNAPGQSLAAVLLAARSDSGDLHTWPISIFVP